MKSGDLIRNKRKLPSAARPTQFFNDVNKVWLGVITKITRTNEKTKYNIIDVFITYPELVVAKIWLSNREISQCIEVLR